MPANEKRAEGVKLKFGPLMVTMRVFENEDEIRKRTFDYNDLDLRKWYGKTVIWAVTNGYAVELEPAGK